jgi:hypothetical protein
MCYNDDLEKLVEVMVVLMDGGRVTRLLGW